MGQQPPTEPRGHRPSPLTLARGARGRIVTLTLGAVAAGTLLAVRDPNTPGSYGECPVRAVFGIYCPGCGSLRGLHALLTGHPLQAAGHNLLLLPALAWLTWWWAAQTGTAWGRRIPGPPVSARFCYGLLAVIVAFTVLRNLPGSPLAP